MARTGERDSTTLKKPASKAPPSIALTGKADDAPLRIEAHAILRPTFQRAVTLEKVDEATLGELDLTVLMDEWRDQAEKVQKVSLKRPKATPMAQATDSAALFHATVHRAACGRHATRGMPEGTPAARACRASACAAQDAEG